MKVRNSAVTRIVGLTSSVITNEDARFQKHILQVTQKELGTLSNHDTPFPTTILLGEERDQREREDLQREQNQQEFVQYADSYTLLKELSGKVQPKLEYVMKTETPPEMSHVLAQQYMVEFDNTSRGNSVDHVA